MSETKKDKVSILAAIKKLLFEGMPPVAPAPTTTNVKTTDGIEITVDKLEVGGVATINGMPAPANTYNLEDGSSITTDAAGIITAMVPKPAETTTTVPAAQAPAPAPAPAPMPAQQQQPIKYEMTVDGMKSLLEKFATGTPEERIANLETMCKTLMEYNFGWQIREAEEKRNRDAAIAIYNEKIKGLETTVAAQAQELVKADQVQKQMFELVEEFLTKPLADAPGAKMQQFTFNKEKRDAKAKGGINRFVKAAETLQKEREGATS